MMIHLPPSTISALHLGKANNRFHPLCFACNDTPNVVSCKKFSSTSDKIRLQDSFCSVSRSEKYQNKLNPGHAVYNFSACYRFFKLIQMAKSCTTHFLCTLFDGPRRKERVITLNQPKKILSVKGT